MARVVTEIIKRFRGLDLMTTHASLPPQIAQDCMNVIPSPSGGIEKLRKPQPVSLAYYDLSQRNANFANFQNALGVRQLVASAGTTIYSFELSNWAGTLRDTNDLNNATYDYCESNNLMFMANGLRMLKWTSTDLQKWGIDKPTSTPFDYAAGIGSGHLDITDDGWYEYRVAYGNSVTGHIGPASDSSGKITGPLSDVSLCIRIPNPGIEYEDQGIDTVYLFRTRMGGSDFYLHSSFPVTGLPGGYTEIQDDTLDDPDPADETLLYLDISMVAPLINDPPPVGKYLTKFQGRIFVANLEGAPQDIAYSGYERILLGRPEESFPPNNRLRLAIGADEIRGIGAVQSGIVAFSKSNEMFMARGNFEDITIDAPVQYSAFLEQLPFQEGCLSHYTIAETPYGLIWLGADRQLKIWNGSGAPVALCPNLAPLFRSITVGQEENCRGLFMNFLEREWYVFAYPANGIVGLNRILAVDLEQDAERNVGAFPFAIGEIQAFGVVEDSNGVRRLLVLQSGAFRRLLVLSTTVNGIDGYVTVDNLAAGVNQVSELSRAPILRPENNEYIYHGSNTGSWTQNAGGAPVTPTAPPVTPPDTYPMDLLMTGLVGWVESPPAATNDRASITTLTSTLISECAALHQRWQQLTGSDEPFPPILVSGTPTWPMSAGYAQNWDNMSSEALLDQLNIWRNGVTRMVEFYNVATKYNVRDDAISQGQQAAPAATCIWNIANTLVHRIDGDPYTPLQIV